MRETSENGRVAEGLCARRGSLRLPIGSAKGVQATCEAMLYEDRCSLCPPSPPSTLHERAGVTLDLVQAQAIQLSAGTALSTDLTVSMV